MAITKKGKNCVPVPVVPDVPIKFKWQTSPLYSYIYIIRFKILLTYFICEHRRPGTWVLVLCVKRWERHIEQPTILVFISWNSCSTLLRKRPFGPSACNSWSHFTLIFVKFLLHVVTQASLWAERAQFVVLSKHFFCDIYAFRGRCSLLFLCNSWPFFFIFLMSFEQIWAFSFIFLRILSDFWARFCVLFEGLVQFVYFFVNPSLSVKAESEAILRHQTMFDFNNPTSSDMSYYKAMQSA